MTTFSEVAILLLSLQLCNGLHVEILRPKEKTGSDAALVLVPDVDIDGFDYISLGQAIQNTSSLRLWVAIMEEFNNREPNIKEVRVGFDEALIALELTGFNSKTHHVFVAGHGFGGEVVAYFGQFPNRYLDGVLLYSTHLQRGYTIKYPVPVLTLIGDLDGLTRVTRAVDIFEELETEQQENANQKYMTPVVILEGVNHGQFAGGHMSPNMEMLDLVPDVSQSDAYLAIAKYTDAFMNTVKFNLTVARSVLDQGYSTTADLMKPLSNIKALDQNMEHVSKWTNTAQQLVVSLQNTSSVQFVNTEQERLNSDQISRPVLEQSSNYVIKSHTTIYLPDPRDQLSPASPLQLKSKMMSQEAVKKVLPSERYGTSASCKDINQEAFTLAYSKSSQAAKNRYGTRGKPISFQDDIVTSSDLTWIASSLHLTHNATGLFVRATRLHTSIKAIITPGQNDCTLLSPYRALEWIYIDSLRRHTRPH